MQSQTTLTIFTDGGSRGNPGPAAIGVYMEDQDGKQVYAYGEPIGDTTNNVAEYKAVIHALSWIEKNQSGVSSILFKLDSELICKQINGIYKMKSEGLRPLLFAIRGHEAGIAVPIRYTNIPREQNKKADSLVNAALDNKAVVSYN